MLSDFNLTRQRAVFAAPSGLLASVVEMALADGARGILCDFEPSPTGADPAVPADGAAYAAFIAAFADACHAAGLVAGVAVATWSPLWDYALLSATPADYFVDMQMYEGTQVRLGGRLRYQ